MNDAAELERDAAGWFAKNGEMCHANSITAVLCTAQCTHMYICYQVHLWAFYEHANKWIQFPFYSAIAIFIFMFWDIKQFIITNIFKHMYKIFEFIR